MARTNPIKLAKGLYRLFLMLYCKRRLMSMGINERAAWELVLTMYTMAGNDFKVQHYKDTVGYCKKHLKMPYKNINKLT